MDTETEQDKCGDAFQHLKSTQEKIAMFIEGNILKASLRDHSVPFKDFFYMMHLRFLP